MDAGGNSIIVRFIGEDSSLRRSLRSLTEQTERFGTLGAASVAAFATNMSGIVPAVASLAGAVFLIPGAIGVAGAAMATFKIGAEGVGDALAAVGGDAQTFNDAIKGLAPNAQAFVKQVRALSGEWKILQKAVQNHLFAGFATDVKQLGGIYLPILKSGMTGIATAMNGMARYAMQALMSPAVVLAVNTVLSNTRALLDNAGSALGDFVSGFLQLAAIGSDYLPAVGTWLSGIAKDFKDWVSANPDNIRKFIDDALRTFHDLWDIGVNLFDLFRNLFTGSSDGTTFLTVLKDTTRYLADHAEAVKGVLYVMATVWAVGKISAFAASLAGVASSLGLISSGGGIGALLRLAAAAALIGAAADAFDHLQSSVTGGGLIIPDTLDNITGAANALFEAFASWNFAPIFNDIRDEWSQLVQGFVSGSSPIGQALYWIMARIHDVASALAAVPGPWQADMQRLASATDTATWSIDKMHGSIDKVQPKDVLVTQHGAEAAAGHVQWFASTIASLHDKTIYIDQITRYGSIGGPSLVAAAHGRAMGGPVTKGQTYLVGENGPEFLTMAGNGFVTPNHKLGSFGGGNGMGGGTTVTFNGNTSDALATVIMGMIRTGQIQIKAS